MINIAIPMAGPAMFFDQSDFQYPKPLIEMAGKTMLEHVIGYINKIDQPKRYVFIINEEVARKYFLDNIIKLVAGEDAVIIRQSGQTRGSVCSILLGIDYIDNDSPLIISNYDQVIEDGVNEAIEFFRQENADGGLICFESVHPKWSYALVPEGRHKVLEVTEKRPVSNNSIAGFYYYKHGFDFVESAKKTIIKDANIEGNYYTSLTYNEMILSGKSILMYKIKNEMYHSFYTAQRIREYIKLLNS